MEKVCRTVVALLLFLCTVLPLFSLMLTGCSSPGKETGELTDIERAVKTDGLPVIEPTEEKIADYLRYTPYQAEDVIVKSGSFTASDVAENAILAGCSPQLMPVCIALSQALNDADWINSLKNTHASTPFAWLNGPVAGQLSVDGEQGMISETSNKVLARFLRFALMNMTELAFDSAFGSVEPYVFSEDDNACARVGWEPYHVTKGFNADDSAVTLSSAVSWGNNLTPATPEGEKIMELIAWDMTEKESTALGSGKAQSRRTIFITESVAANLAKDYKSKEDLENALIAEAKRPLALRAYANYWANPDEKISDQYSFEEYYGILAEKEAQSAAVPGWYQFQFPNMGTMKAVDVAKSGETQILIAGDASRNKVQIMAGGPCVTVGIELPENWEELLETRETEEFECDDACEFNPASIVSPVGYNTIEMIEQASRLDTLEGKKIALVGRSFNATVTQEVLTECLQKDYPTASFYTADDLGYGGSYHALNPSKQTRDFQKKLKEYGIDAVISGNAGCGLCSVKETGSCIAAEYIGIPAVAVAGTSFVSLVQSTGVNRGVPVIRTVEYPGAFSADSVETLKKNAKEILYPGIVKALTTPITQEETDSLAKEGKRAYDEAVASGSDEMLQTFCKMSGWTDGLPVELATAEKVEKYLRYTPYSGETILGAYPVAYRETRVYTVAVNAIMAGCPPEYMPLCIAFVKTMSDPDWRKTLASTHGWSPYAWINGPVARQLGIECGAGMMNAENNRKLARFIDLAMLNIGGYYTKENRMGTFGYLTPWVFTEDEESCVAAGWKPYHTTQGFGLNENTLTAASAVFVGPELTPQTNDPVKIKNVIAFDVTEKQQNALGNTSATVYRTMFVTPDLAKKLGQEYETKLDLETALIETARRPFRLRVYAAYWANPGSYQYETRTITKYYKMLESQTDEDVKMTPVPDWYKSLLPDTEEIITNATMRQGDTPILVVGSTDAGKVQLIPGGGYATVKIDLPGDWDDLMSELGYKPLENYYLK